MTNTKLEIETKALMNQREAAAYLGTTVGTMNSWRTYSKNDPNKKIPYVLWGNRIRYRKADLDAFIERNYKGNTDDQNN